MSFNYSSENKQNKLSSWISALKIYKEPSAVKMLFLGFSAGLPLLLVFGTLSFWLREAGIKLETIGYLAWINLTYAFKWLWSPFIDNLEIPILTKNLGRRRSWLLVSQVFVILALVGMSLSDPQTNLNFLVFFALLTAFASATQDIVLDAFRIESAEQNKQAALAATYQTGYRLAMIWAGAGVLWLADYFQQNNLNYDFQAWQSAYLIMAFSMIVGIIIVFFSKEPIQMKLENDKFDLNKILIQPFTDFIQRYKVQAILVLLLISIYRISDVVMGAMANPFYIDLGFSKSEIAWVIKTFGIIMTLLGTFLGGIIAFRIGIMKSLMLGALMSSMSNLLFTWLSFIGKDLNTLILVIGLDNLSAGIATASFVAYLSSLTNIKYSATQYALFSSIMLLFPKWLSGFSGKFVVNFGYSNFFISTALLGIPVIILIYFINRQNNKIK